jgi:hypothetical protein
MLDSGYFGSERISGEKKVRFGSKKFRDKVDAGTVYHTQLLGKPNIYWLIVLYVNSSVREKIRACAVSKGSMILTHQKCV